MKTTMKLLYAGFAVVLLAVGALTVSGAPEAPTVRPTPTPRPRPAGPSDLFASVNGQNIDGGGFVYRYTPTGVQSTFASGLSRPRGLAFDGTGNLFVTSGVYITYPTDVVATILKINPGGGQTTFFSMRSSFFFEGLATDRSGNVFVMAQDNSSPTIASTIFKFTPNGIQSTFGAVPGDGWGLAFDSAGSLFAASALDQTIYEFAPDGTRTVFVGPTAFGPNVYPAGGLAFDRFDNLFVCASTDPCCQGEDVILEFAPDGTETTFATGLNVPRGLAFDNAGNLFVAEIIQSGPGDILKFPPNGTRTVFASGIGPGGNGGPEFLAFPRRPGP
jgi:hypothetical protein